MLHRLLLATARFGAAVAALSAFAAPAAAQTTVAIEGLAGYAAFVDDSAVEHGVVGAAARVYVAPRHSLGPEVVYMRGPGADRDWFLTVNYTFDFIPQGDRKPRRRVNPFLVAGAGYMRHQNRFGGSAFSANEGALTGGGGVRVWLTDRIYALGDVRLGWEPHLRINGGVGMTWP